MITSHYDHNTSPLFFMSEKFSTTYFHDDLETSPQIFSQAFSKTSSEDSFVQELLLSPIASPKVLCTPGTLFSSNKPKQFFKTHKDHLGRLLTCTDTPFVVSNTPKQVRAPLYDKPPIYPSFEFPEPKVNDKSPFKLSLGIPFTIDFGICGKSKRELRICNSSNSPLIIYQWQVDIPFYLPPSKEIIVNPLTFIQVPVVFYPTKPGTFTAEIKWQSNQPMDSLQLKATAQ